MAALLKLLLKCTAILALRRLFYERFRILKNSRNSWDGQFPQRRTTNFFCQVEQLDAGIVKYPTDQGVESWSIVTLLDKNSNLKQYFWNEFKRFYSQIKLCKVKKHNSIRTHGH